jgi:hypothetical protein
MSASARLLSTRALWLIGLAAALAVGRLAMPPAAAPELATASPTKRAIAPAPGKAPVTEPVAPRAMDAASDAESVGNAFAVRAPKVEAPAPAAAPVAAVVMPPPPPPPQAPVIAQAPPAPAEPANATPPFRVIGTFDDGEPGVFIATASGAVLARPGANLPGDYRLSALTRAEAVFTHAPTQRTTRYPLPHRVGQ